MTAALEITAVISRARGAARVIELEICGHTWTLYRDNKKHLPILAGLYRAFEGRTTVHAHELRGLAIQGEAWLDPDGELGDLVWLAPQELEPVDPGPELCARAARAFWGIEPRRRRGGRDAAVIRETVRGAACVDCGAPAAHAHHLVARAHGGEDVAENLVPLCAACHRRRHKTAAPRRSVDVGRYRVEIVGVEEPDLLGTSVVTFQALSGPTGTADNFSLHWDAELGYSPVLGAVYEIHVARGEAPRIAYVELLNGRAPEAAGVPAAPTMPTRDQAAGLRTLVAAGKKEFRK